MWEVVMESISIQAVLHGETFNFSAFAQAKAGYSKTTSHVGTPKTFRNKFDLAFCFPNARGTHNCMQPHPVKFPKSWKKGICKDP